MKTSVLSHRAWWLLAVVIMAAGCDDKKSPEEIQKPDPTPIRVEEIIVSPKVADPGDTLSLTADIRSSSTNEGDIPTTQWTANGGTILENNKLTVRWQAPMVSGVYEISVKATNAAGSASKTTRVFTGTPQMLVGDKAGGMYLRSGGPALYFQQAQDLNNFTELGSEAYEYVAGVSDAIPQSPSRGFEMAFSPALTYEVHAYQVLSADSTVPSASVKPRHLYLGDLTTGTLQRITAEEAVPIILRRQQFSWPSISPDGDLIAYQGTATNFFNAALDSNEIYVYRRSGPERIRATFRHDNHRNYVPSFSTDQAWLTFISDRSGSGQWELYGMPVSGAQVDTSRASVTRLTNTGGTITSGLSEGGVARPLMAWNPVVPTLAIRAADQTVYLVTTNAGGAAVDQVDGLPASVQDLAWSPSGNTLAVVAADRIDDEVIQKIYTVSGAVATERFSSLSGDLIADLAWSPDDAWIVLRRTRAAGTWFELLDIDAGKYTQAIPITEVGPKANLEGYSEVTSLRSRWGAGNVVYMLRFLSTGASATPAIQHLDLTGAIQ